MEIIEDPKYSREYLEPDKRSIANAVQVFFSDGTHTEKVEINYPVGHRRRRQEGIPLLKQKFEKNLSTLFPKGHCHKIIELFENQPVLENTAVDNFMELLVIT
jgi:2-methylcitrate dehydratase